MFLLGRIYQKEYMKMPISEHPDQYRVLFKKSLLIGLVKNGDLVFTHKWDDIFFICWLVIYFFSFLQIVFFFFFGLFQ